MNLVDILEEDLINVQLAGTTKEEILDELVQTLAKGKELNDHEYKTVLKAVKNREELGSTGIGKGICIPHAQSEVFDKISLVVGISKVPVDFDSPDNMKSRLFFLVVAPVSAASAHVEVLAAIARSCSSSVFRRMLEKCKSSREVIQLFTE